VISLPAGVFQPYSGVKTSVLLLDKRLAKKSQHILFLKIDNDGFDLGAQRREIDKNDLPSALQTLEAYKECLNNDKAFNDLPSLATLVTRETVLANKDIVLSAERYFVADAINTDYEIVKLEDVCDFIDYRGKTPTKTESGIRLITAKNVRKGHLSLEPLEYIAEADYESWMTRGIPSKGDVLITTEAPLGNVAQIDTDEKIALAQRIITLIPKSDNLDKAFLKNALLSDQVQFELNGFATGSTVLGIKSSSLKDISIPLPPLEIQQQIVAEIEGYQKIIDGAKQVVTNYKPTITIKPEWEMVELDQLCDVRDGTHDSPKYVLENGVPFVTQKNITKEGLSFDDIQYISREDHQKIIKRSNVEFGDIIISMIGANRGMSCVIDDNREFSIKNVGLIKSIGKINHAYLLYYLKSATAQDYIGLMSSGGAQQFIGLTTLRKFPIPVPDITEQTAIVKAIEEEMQLVSANKRIIEIFEQKIKTKISEVWGVKANAYQLENENLSMAAEP
jgi:type I restriction enzyme M protein